MNNVTIPATLLSELIELARNQPGSTDTVNTASNYYNQSDDEISILWHIDDIKSVRNDLTDNQCREILESLQDDHDANIGINWDTIAFVAYESFPLS